jgi:hypothetical protein
MQSWPKCGGQKKICVSVEFSGCPAHSLATVLTEPSQLFYGSFLWDEVSQGMNFNISGFHIVVLFNLSEEKVQYIYRLTQLSKVY